MSPLCHKQGTHTQVLPIPQPPGSEQAQDACWGKPHASAERGGPTPPGEHSHRDVGALSLQGLTELSFHLEECSKMCPQFLSGPDYNQ